MEVATSPASSTAAQKFAVGHDIALNWLLPPPSALVLTQVGIVGGGDAGFVEEIALPLLSTATQRLELGHETAVTSLPLSKGVFAGWPDGGGANCHTGVPALGAMLVRRLPLSSTAAQRTVESTGGAHDIPKMSLVAGTAELSVSGTGFNHDAGGPVGLVVFHTFPILSPATQEVVDEQAIELIA